MSMLSESMESIFCIVCKFSVDIRLKKPKKNQKIDDLCQLSDLNSQSILLEYFLELMKHDAKMFTS